jgi:hypothetical protein
MQAKATSVLGLLLPWQNTGALPHLDFSPTAWCQPVGLGALCGKLVYEGGACHSRVQGREASAGPGGAAGSSQRRYLQLPQTSNSTMPWLFFWPAGTYWGGDGEPHH